VTARPARVSNTVAGAAIVYFKIEVADAARAVAEAGARGEPVDALIAARDIAENNLAAARRAL